LSTKRNWRAEGQTFAQRQFLPFHFRAFLPTFGPAMLSANFLRARVRGKPPSLTRRFSTCELVKEPAAQHAGEANATPADPACRPKNRPFSMELEVGHAIACRPSEYLAARNSVPYVTDLSCANGLGVCDPA